MTELPPDVRAEAAQAALDQHRGCDEDFHGGRIVDAVVAVVAPEIARPLQARIEELEGKAEHWRQRWENRNEHFDLLSCERDALQARLHAQHASNAEFMRGQADEFAAERDALQARVEELEGRDPQEFEVKAALRILNLELHAGKVEDERDALQATIARLTEERDRPYVKPGISGFVYQQPATIQAIVEAATALKDRWRTTDCIDGDMLKAIVALVTAVEEGGKT
jgi:hypothetical protein